MNNNTSKIYVFLGTNKNLITYYDFKNRTTSQTNNYSFKTSKASSYIEFTIPDSQKKSRTFLTDLKATIKKEIGVFLKNNAYKTSIKPYGTENNNNYDSYTVDYYPISSFDVNYVMKTHFFSGLSNTPSGVNKKETTRYVGLVSEQIREIKKMNVSKDQVFLVDVSMKLSKFGLNPKSRKKSICKFHQKQYDYYKGKVNNRIQKTYKKAKKKIKRISGRRNNNNNNNNNSNNNNSNNITRRNNQIRLNEGRRITSKTRRERQLNVLRKKQQYNTSIYRTERDYLDSLRKKVQKSLIDGIKKKQ